MSLLVKLNLFCDDLQNKQGLAGSSDFKLFFAEDFNGKECKQAIRYGYDIKRRCKREQLSTIPLWI